MKVPRRRWGLIPPIPLWAAALAVLLFSPAAAERASAQRAPGSVSVRVTEFDNEQPIFQAEVTLSAFARGTFTHRAFTDGSGGVSFSSVERGSYILEVRKWGFEPARENLEVGPGESVSSSIRLRRTESSFLPDATGKPVSATSLAVPGGARKEFDAGVAALKEDPIKSIPHFLKAIEQYPQYAEAYTLLGMAQMRTKQGEAAMKSLTRAIELDSKLRLAHTSMGELLVEQRQYVRAEKELLESYQLDSQAWDTAFHLARCYYNMGKLERALDYAQRAQGAPQSPATTHLLLVDIYLRRNDAKGALEELDAFAKADPNSPFMPRVDEMRKKLRKSVSEGRPPN